jgi:GntR family transcriptional regulator
MYEEVSLPERYFPGLSENARMPLRISDLAQEFGLVLGRGVEIVSAVAADAAAADGLSVARGAPVLKLDRVVSAIDGRPVEWRIAICHLIDENYITDFA